MRKRRAGCRWIVLTFGSSLLIASGGCAAGSTRPPSVEEAGGQGSAQARISTTSPLIVEWPAAERGRLETHMAKGAVAVHYQGASLTLLPDCHPSGAYDFVPMVPKSEHLIFGSALDLDASFPLGAARLGARLEAGKQLELTTRLVGRWEVSDARKKDRDQERTHGCEEATHLVSAATVGAFRLYASSRVFAGAGAQLSPGAGVSANGQEERSVLNADGSPDRCAETTSEGPPRECGALIRLELTSFESQQKKLLHELGTLDFTPIEKRLYSSGVEDRLEPLPFPLTLCDEAQKGTFGAARAALASYCAAGVTSGGTPHSGFPATPLIDELRTHFTLAKKPLARFLLLDALIRKEGRADEKIIAELQTLADEHNAETDLGYWARYLLSGSGAPDIEEQNLRELIKSPRLRGEPWPRMRLAQLMLSRDRAQAVSLAQNARSLAPQCAKERLAIIDWLASEGSGVLSSGELFDVQLDGVRTLSSQGKLPSTAPLGRRAIRSHDFRTWDASKQEFSQDQWALGALYWAEGAECLFRGNRKCAALEWRELLETAPDSPYVVPAYQALLRVTGKSDPTQLAALSKLRPAVHVGAPQRTRIGEQPTCGALTEEQLQAVLDQAQELAVLHAAQLSGTDTTWEVDSLSAIAPDLSSCAVENPSNGKTRLLVVRVNPEQKKIPVRVAPGDESPESKSLATCVGQRTTGNASLFSTAFQVSIRVAPQPLTSFDHGQGWARHVRERFACTAGDDDACIRLGKEWLSGEELPREPAHALAIFTAKCGEGNQEACVEEALLRIPAKEARSVNVPTKSRNLLEGACVAGRGEACRLLLSVGHLTEKDLNNYRDLLQRGCFAPLSDPASCVELWYAQEEGVLPPLDQAEAQALLGHACTTLSHGTVEGDCSTPAALMAAYPHHAGEALGILTCQRGIWQGCESALIACSPPDRNKWAQAGCRAGSPDACEWLTRQDSPMTVEETARLLRRVISLCEKHEDIGHKSVCDSPQEVAARLAVLEWKGKKSKTPHSQKKQ